MVGFAGLLTALACAPSAGAASAGDVATTRTLARATDVLVREANPEVSRGLAAAQRYARGLSAQCPRVAAGSPQNEQSERLDDEVIGAMTTVGYRVARASVARFARAVRGLHWSNPRLTRALARFTRKLRGLTTLATPDVCGDVKAWAASSFQTVPPSTLAFAHKYFATDVEAEEVPTIVSLAMPSATPSEVPVLKRVERLERKLGEAEAAAVESYSRLIMALELQQ
jgi:hypothetical protein